MVEKPEKYQDNGSDDEDEEYGASSDELAEIEQRNLDIDAKYPE